MKCPFCIKYCKYCERLLVAYKGNFDKMKKGKYGFENKCKECRKEYNQSDKGKEVQAKAHAKYNQSDKGKQTQAKANAKFRQNNPNYNKQWYEDNPNYNKQYWDKYLEQNGLERGEGSIGEQKVRQVLTNMNIQFEEQYKFNDCRFKLPLPFDFYIRDLNTLIEYDGKQHFTFQAFGSKDEDAAFNKFVTTKITDTIKNEYAKRNNINLIRIPYWQFNNIEEILSDLQ